MNTIKTLERLIYASASWKFISILFAVSLLKTGIWFIPNISFSSTIAQNPFVNPFHADPMAQYLLWNWLGSLIAWATGATSKGAFFLLHLSFSIAFSLLYAVFVFNTFPDEIARKSLILFVSLPISATTYLWVGYDSITVFLMLLTLVLPQYATLTILSGILLGMQHFEQASAAVSALTFCTFFSPTESAKTSYPLKFCLLLLFGVIGGKLILVEAFRFYSIEAQGRWYYLGQSLYSYLKAFLFHFQYILWSLLGVGWWIALRYAGCGRRTVPFFVTLFGLFLLAAIVGDQTRVIAIITFPLLAAYWLFNQDFLTRIPRYEMSTYSVAWAVVPLGWVWGGIPRWSVFPYDIAYVLYKLFGWFGAPADPFSFWSD
jgi:hypothetical protein